MPRTESKTKIRPQQSCLKCRERKVKCDRSVPCHACIVRGLEAECTYLPTADDRAQISQAETIERLRREVAQLQSRLEQSTCEPHRVRTDHRIGSQHTGHRGLVAAAAADAAESSSSSWRGSSPSPSPPTMTSSRTVTSPESSGSDSGGHPHSVATGSCDSQVIAADAGALFNLMDAPTFPNCYAGGMTLPPGEMSMHQAMPMYRTDSPDYTQLYTERDLRAKKDEPDAYHHHYQWSQDAEAYGHQYTNGPLHAYSDQSLYHSSTSTFANSNGSADASPLQSLSAAAPAVGDIEGPATPPDILAPRNAQIPDFSSWKEKSKQELLEALLETIGSCDEQCVAQVVQVVRTSPTPEGAVTGICRILGIGAWIR